MSQKIIRKALVIGVGSIPEAEHRFPSLSDPVAIDVQTLRTGLTGSGYEVEELLNPTRNEITGAITRVAEKAPPNSVQLIHFTGHGVRIDATDYLLPSDARVPEDDAPASWRRPHIRESLLDIDISGYLEGCRAGTVLWTVDACRASEDSTGEPAFGNHMSKGHQGGGFAMMTGCGPGQRCGYTDEGSHFTSALAKAFGPLTTATTVEGIYDLARRHTTQLAARHHSEPQEPRIRYGTDLEEQTKIAEVAQGRRLLESWQKAVKETPLWSHVPGADRDGARFFQECLTSLAEKVAHRVHMAQKRMPDPWTDDGFPVRLLCDRLPQLLAKNTELSALEVTALISGVFLHESAWADRLSQAFEVDPQIARPLSDANDQRRYYEQVMEHYPQITRKLDVNSVLSRLSKRAGKTSDPIVLWLVHHWIGERFETDERSVPDEPATVFTSELLDDAQKAGRSPNHQARELSRALRTISSGLALGLPSSEQLTSLPPWYTVQRRSQRLRVRPLAALLQLAGLLSLDPRTLPVTVAAHLGVTDPVQPHDVASVFTDAEWRVEEAEAKTLYLSAACPHPAIHAGLEQIIEEANDLVDNLRTQVTDLPGHESELFQGLPVRIDAKQLRPEMSLTGSNVYDRPLLRFSMDQTEVRRLLMGENLYEGDRRLAVRELYQNAMDACRYRDMRSRYLQARDEHTDPWEGRIRVTAGEDDHGPFVECRDNGVGMTMDQLRGTFAQGGRRFGQTRAFRREQESWLRQDRSLRLYPNSRFGIGVFSYFMLAEEMTVVTRPVGTDGVPERKALRIDISSGESLFRIKEGYSRSPDSLPEGGTRIRLYLRSDHHISADECISVLGSLVHLSEFHLEVHRTSGDPWICLPGVLQPGTHNKSVFRDRTIATNTAIEAVPGRLWWVKGEGAILNDGIATDKHPFGYVLNLTREEAGDLSTNRKKLLRHDQQAAQQHLRVGAQALPSWSEWHLDWLHALDKRNLEAASVIWPELQGRGISITTGTYTRASLDDVGCFSLDRYSKDGSPSPDEKYAWAAVRPWRAVALDSPVRHTETALPLSLEGHPVPGVGWGATAKAQTEQDWRSLLLIAKDQEISVAEVLRRARAMRVAHPSLLSPRVSAHDPDWVPEYQDAVIMHGMQGRDRPIAFESSSADNYRHHHGDLSGIVRASATTSQSLGELAKWCTRYMAFVDLPWKEIPAHHRDHVCDRHDLDLLYTKLDESTWRPRTLPWEVVDYASEQDISTDEVWQRLDRFSWLGWRLPDRDLVRRWTAIPDDFEWHLRRYLEKGLQAGSPSLPWAATINLAEDWELTLGEAEEELAAMAKLLGIEYQRRYLPGNTGYDLVPERGSGGLASSLYNAEISLEAGISLRDLGFARPYDIPWEDIAEAADELRDMGVDLPDAMELLRQWDDLTVPERYLLSGNDPSFDAANYPVLPTADVLFSAGVHLRQDLASSWRSATDLCTNVGLSREYLPPPLPASLLEFRPTWDEVTALIDLGPDEDFDEWFESPRWMPLTPHRLIGYARARHINARNAFTTLEPLRAIGALIPGLSTDEVSALPEQVPGLHDEAALDPQFRVSEPGSPLTPLDVVSIAGHLGEPMRDTWRRIAPYLPLEPATTQVHKAPDVLPLWQDLAILSTGLNGALPAVSGPITDERLAFAAQGVGESSAWVRQRLEHYAELFGLELPPIDVPAERNETA